MEKYEEINIGNLEQDDKNFNLGTPRGEVLMQRSFERFGAGRPVLVDKNNRLIAGNKSVLAASKNDINDVIVVDTEGEELVAVQRDDIDLDELDGREMALADNMTSKVNQNFDYAAIQEAMDSVNLDAELWGITDIYKKVEDAKKEYKTNEQKREKAKAFFKFKGYNIPMSKEEYDALNSRAEDYFDEMGVMIGFIADLLGI